MRKKKINNMTGQGALPLVYSEVKHINIGGIDVSSCKYLQDGKCIANDGIPCKQVDYKYCKENK